MSTAAASSTAIHDNAARYFLLRRLHSLTGLVFGGYLVVHLLVNATLIEGARHGGEPSIFAQQVAKIHSLPFLTGIEWCFIYLPIIFHTIYGIWVAIAGQPNVNNYPYGKNIYYTLQRLSAIIIVAFMLFHILGFKGVLGTKFAFVATSDYTVESVKHHFQAHWSLLYIIYPISVLASCFHLANGFWGAGITWGLTVSKAAQRRWGFVCAGIFLFTLVCGMLALVAVAEMQDVQSPAPWLSH